MAITPVRSATWFLFFSWSSSFTWRRHRYKQYAILDLYIGTLFISYRKSTDDSTSFDNRSDVTSTTVQQNHTQSDRPTHTDVPNSRVPKDVTKSTRSRTIKISTLAIGWFLLTAILSQTNEKVLPEKHIVIPHSGSKCAFINDNYVSQS